MAKKKETKKVEPIPFELGKMTGESFGGETFEIIKTTRGIVYKTYGGYSIFVTPNNVALYETLNDLVVNKEEYSNLVGKDKSDFELNLSAIAYVLNVPLIAFTDAAFTFEMAQKVIEFLTNKYEEALNVPLQEETFEENQMFEDAVKGLETIKESLKEEEHLD